MTCKDENNKTKNHNMKKLLLSLFSLLLSMTVGADTSGSFAYWTAQGQVMPLPVGDNRQVVVPAEAVAVDLRGQEAIGSLFTVDTSQANPNCLYYLDQPGDLPEGLDERLNIVRGVEAETIRLTEDYDYYCPLAFHTRFISFLVNPSYNKVQSSQCTVHSLEGTVQHLDDELLGRGYSETLVLPFYPRHASLYDVNGESGMLHADKLKVLRYYGNEGDSLNIVQLNSISQMHAYEPYILGVYIGSKLLFIGENTRVPVTREAVVCGQDVNFVGTTVARQLSTTSYQYNPDDAHFYPSTARIAPFRAYMDLYDSIGHASCLAFSDEVWGAKGNPSDASAIDDIPVCESRLDSGVVCDLSGRQLVSGPDACRGKGAGNRQLHKGIYIVGGRKVVVK